MMLGNVRFGYVFFENVGFFFDILVKIDKVVEEVIVKGVIFGCVVLVVKNGCIVYEKVYGYYSYDCR